MSETGSNLISSLNKSGTGMNLTNLVSGLVEAENSHYSEPYYQKC